MANSSIRTPQADPGEPSVAVEDFGDGTNGSQVVLVNGARVAIGTTSNPLVANSPNNSTRIDEASPTVSYIGKAAIGAAPGDPVWQIHKIDMSSGFALTWADGNANFDNIWNNRASLTYV